MNTEIHQAQVKAARNQSLFREVNERVQQLQRGWTPLSEIDFVCECADEACMAPISMPVSEYEEIRKHAERFFVRPRHIYPEVEVVVAKSDRYWTVEKVADAAPIAAALDPRRATEAAA